MEVEDFHTYFVGEYGVLVHNEYDAADGGPKGESQPVSEYEVGTFDDLQRRSIKGDDLDIHHVGQKHPMSQVVEGYDQQKAPSIAIPRKEHVKIPTIKGEYTGNARDILAKDISDLRNYTKTPNSALKELIKLNKRLFPGAF